MKKNILYLLFNFIAFGAVAQSSVGLIAHWDMNGTANDVSGHGHTGHLHNVTPDTGMSGAPNTAYYFNGTNSYISAGYMADLNLTKYTICATIKVKGFYTGTCFANAVFTRGPENGVPGHYNLYFTDVVNGCTGADDTTNEVFCPGAGPNTVAAGLSTLHYTPTIQKNQWYRLVLTYDSSNWKMFVNGVLKYNAPGQRIPMGTSADSIAMGMDIYQQASGYPYNFKGTIDDIRLYNRALSDSEAYGYALAVNNVLPTEEPVNIYPNPANSRINIELPTSNNAGQAQLFNLMGQVVATEPITGRITELSIGNLPVGIYVAVIEVNGATVIKRIVKE